MGSEMCIRDRPGDILISRLVMLLVINLVFSLPVVIPVIIVRCSLGAVGGYEVLAFALVFALLPFFALAAVEAFAGDQIPEAVRTPLACTLLVLAALLSIVSFRRWIRIEAAMRHTRPLPVPQASILLVLGIAIGAVLLVVAILAGTIS